MVWVGLAVVGTLVGDGVCGLVGLDVVGLPVGDLVVGLPT